MSRRVDPVGISLINYFVGPLEILLGAAKRPRGLPREGGPVMTSLNWGAVISGKMPVQCSLPGRSTNSRYLTDLGPLGRYLPVSTYLVGRYCTLSPAQQQMHDRLGNMESCT